MMIAVSESTNDVLASTVITFSLHSVSDKSLSCSGNMKELLLMMILPKTITHEFTYFYQKRDPQYINALRCTRLTIKAQT